MVYGEHLTVIQPTPFCNIDCRYCYLTERRNRAKISLDTIRAAGRFVATSDLPFERYRILWHAGEPLVVGAGFYRQAHGVLAEEFGRKPFRHVFQTNGMLIDDEWIELFTELGCHVGLSIDGPKHIHDSNRVARNGTGTFDQVMRGLESLRNASIKPSVICVVTSDSVHEPDLIFDFFSEIGIHSLGFNPEEVEADNPDSSLDHESIRLYAKFLERIYERNETSSNPLEIREFRQSKGKIYYHLNNSENRNQQVEPWDIISIDHSGNVSTFSPELLGSKVAPYGDFIFGNVHSDTLHSCQNSAAFKLVSRDIAEGVNKCRSECEYFRCCRGGAPSNKLFENGSFDSTLTLACALGQIVPLEVLLSSDRKRAIRDRSTNDGNATV